jgi:hypothetical protein
MSDSGGPPGGGAALGPTEALAKLLDALDVMGEKSADYLVEHWDDLWPLREALWAAYREGGGRLPYPEDRGGTHWDGCWRDRGHHNCAMAEIERLSAPSERAAALPPTDTEALRERMETTIAYYFQTHGVGEDVSARVLSERLIGAVQAQHEVEAEDAALRASVPAHQQGDQ